jgi:hypothetical protein
VRVCAGVRIIFVPLVLAKEHTSLLNRRGLFGCFVDSNELVKFDSGTTKDVE